MVRAMTLTSGNSAKNRKGRKGRQRRRVQEDFFLSSHVACRRKVKRAPNSKRKPEETNLRRESRLNNRDKKSILTAIVKFQTPNYNRDALVIVLIDKAMHHQVKDKGSNHNKIEDRTMRTTSTDGKMKNWYLTDRKLIPLDMAITEFLIQTNFK